MAIQPDNKTYYIFGDIEGYQRICDAVRREWDQPVQYIFLGDLFFSKHIETSIKFIEELMKKFDIDIKSYVETSTELNKEHFTKCITQVCKTLITQKSLNKYNNSQSFAHWKKIGDIPEEDFNSNHKQCLFLFGNKEISFVHAIINSKTEFNFRYNDKKKDYEINITWEKIDTKKIINSTFTVNDFNIFISYMYECHHYYIIGDTILLHCYENVLKLNNNEFKNIICGHNKGVGKFFDFRLPNKDIYMNDFTNAALNLPDKVSIHLLVDQSGSNIQLPLPKTRWLEAKGIQSLKLNR